MAIVHRYITPNESVVCAELDEEAVLLNIETGIYFGLDAVGTRIWNMLKEGVTESSIVDQLLEEYDVEPARLRADVAEFLDQLAAKALACTQDAQAR